MGKFKVGDNVKVTQSCMGKDGDCGIIIEDDGTTCPYKVFFECRVGHKTEWVPEENLELVEEEKVMKFKVGDKVKVSNSWEGHDGATGQIVYINVYHEFTHEVRFEDMGAECFREEELELVKAKQQFTKSDLKTGMGVVLRNGDKAHVLLGTGDGDVMRFLEKDTWDTLKSANEDLTWKGMDNFDIVEVYSTKLASRYLTDMVFEEKCVFKREEPKPEPKPTKMTMKEINEHFGKPIEIVE